MDLQSLLQILINKKGSDLHLRSGGPPYIRVDGELIPAVPETVSDVEVRSMLDSVLTKRGKKIFEEKGECDFSFQVGDVARFRVNAFTQRQRLCMAIRFISTRIPTMAELKLPETTVRKIADNRRGLVLITGITGSGKSSTLAAMVDYINGTRAEHILTIEDPIEFVHKDKKAIITQREIGEDTESYAQGLKMALRQDPDIIMVGEMRDLETTAAALTAAQTGHLVFGTLHTIDAIQTISRVIDLYPPHQQPLVRLQLAESLRAVISQRLLPCMKGGRAPAMEILIVTAHIRKLIEDNKSGAISEACAKGGFYGMQTFNQSLAKLFKDGLVKEEDVMAAASSPDDLKLVLRGIQQQAQVG